MKIMTILGTRPEIIRLSIIIKKLDQLCEHILVHTGQNYAESLNDVFFRELDLRNPDYSLGIKSPNFAQQIGSIITEIEKILIQTQPDKILILGDTNSGLTSIVAKRLGIKVYHMEAGNRCYDDRVPEEVNRRIIDHSSDVLMPYTHRSKENLIREGIERKRIFVTGNPINEILNSFDKKINDSTILSRLEIYEKEYFLVTMHRAENVDDKSRLKNIIESLELLNKKYKLPIICSLHPRTRGKIQQFNINNSNKDIHFLEPLGFFDFVKLEKSAFVVLSDSGTVQEECCIYNIPNVTIRDVTERPETIESGSNIISGNAPEDILRSVQIALISETSWYPPLEYLEKNVSDKVIKILFNHQL